jgi:hypothetical protein
VPQLLIIADRVKLGSPPDAPEGAPVMGGFSYENPDEGVEFAVNVHDVYVDALGSYANVSVIYVLPDEAAEEPHPDEAAEEPQPAAAASTESNGTATLHVVRANESEEDPS